MSDAIFELKQEDHYHGMWRANFDHAPELRGDLLAFMWLEKGTWIFRYRFRYFLDKKVWESKDKRATYQVKMPDEPEAKDKMFKAINRLFDVLTKAGAIENLEYYPCGGTGVDMAKIIEAGIPGMSMKKMKQEEFEEYQRTNKMPEGK